ncbi:MAG TPA: EAL domain-containing protein [Burkholderiales bacterium]|nr:EAL domain-containing protein [Burkholderiales bacterium]
MPGRPSVNGRIPDAQDELLTRRGGIVIGSYSFPLVVLSWVVASFASFTALDLASRISASKGVSARVWLLGGACAMGTGIWSMHFTGMLAFSLPIPMGYDVPTTLLSMLIAIIVSGFALLIVTRNTLSRRNLLIGGVLVGLGISSMHYTGMAAMEVFPPIRYNPLLVAASIGIAIAAALAALWIAFTLRASVGRGTYAKLGSAVVMGLAIVGMHYTAMAAAGFAADSICTTGAVVDNSWMAATIVFITFLVLCETLVLSVLDSRMASKTAHMAASLQEANAELQHLVLHDALTKLPNRLLLEDRIQQAAQEGQRSSTLCAVLFVDLDRFKAVNDSLGHFAGDELLRVVAERLRSVVRQEDTVSRLGGDEFVILLRRVAIADDAALVARKIIDTLSQPVRSHGQELRVSASIGITLYPQDGESAATLITRADAAMYHVKKSGRNAYRFFEPEMSTFFPDRLTLRNELHTALEDRQFVLHYQPKIDVRNGRLTGMEALVRWRHPERGLVSPTEFIPLAEETGLIVPLGQWVLREACLQNKAWQDRGLPRARVAVNISGVQFQNKDLVASIEDVLRETGLDPRFLELEITESVIMQNASEAVEMLERIGRMGVEISIDDFGTGYSSLSYLKRFSINKLKIDQSFINNISHDKDDAAIVQAIVALAHSLRLRVVAEGVEQKEQLEFLRLVGDDEYQGYLHSRPLSAAEFERYLEAAEPHAALAPAALAASAF